MENLVQAREKRIVEIQADLDMYHRRQESNRVERAALARRPRTKAEILSGFEAALDRRDAITRERMLGLAAISPKADELVTHFDFDNILVVGLSALACRSQITKGVKQLLDEMWPDDALSFDSQQKNLDILDAELDRLNKEERELLIERQQLGDQPRGQVKRFDIIP